MMPRTFFLLVWFLLFLHTLHVHSIETLRWDNPSGNPSERYGEGIAVDGRRIIVGRPDGATDYVYVYLASSLNAHDWTLQTSLVPGSPTGSEKFGWAVASDGKRIAVGDISTTGRVHVFWETTLYDGSFTEVLVESGVSPSNSYFGYAVAIKDLRLVVGAKYEDSVGTSNSGIVYLFVESSVDAHDWLSNMITLEMSIPSDDCYLGSSVALQAGLDVVAGANGELANTGAVIVWSESSSGMNDYLLDETRITIADGVSPENFGYGVFHSGLNIFASAPFDDYGIWRGGALYVLTETSLGSHDWGSNMIRFAPEGVASMEQACTTFAHSGTMLVCGSYAHDSSRGRVFVLEESELGARDWESHQYIVEAFDVANTHYFGSHVAADGTTIVAQAWLPNLSGAVYVNPCPNGMDYNHTFNRCLDPTDCRLGVSCNNGVCATTGPDAWEGYLHECNCTGSGATGMLCEVDIDECLSNPCMNGGICLNLGFNFPTQFNCTCDSNFEGNLCETEINMCESSPCLNNGVCTSTTGIYACNCTDTGFEGGECQTEISKCISSPCENGGTCSSLPSDFTCDCTGTGYEGLVCSDDIDDCTSMPCFAGSCTDAGNFAFTCNCTDTGFEGDLCQTDVDDCASNPCLNSGVCTDTGLYSKACNCTGTGFEGDVCQTDVDDCLSNPCLNGGTCSDAGISLTTCDCMGTGFQGDLCEVNVDDCTSNPCLNGGTCVDGVLSLSCACPGLYEGDFCADAIPLPDLNIADYCASNPCANNAICTNNLVNETFYCDCPAIHTDSMGYYGKDCSEECDKTDSTAVEAGLYLEVCLLNPVKMTVYFSFPNVELGFEQEDLESGALYTKWPRQLAGLNADWHVYQFSLIDILQQNGDPLDDTNDTIAEQGNSNDYFVKHGLLLNEASSGQLRADVGIGPAEPADQKKTNTPTKIANDLMGTDYTGNQFQVLPFDSEPPEDAEGIQQKCDWAICDTLGIPSFIWLIISVLIILAIVVVYWFWKKTAGATLKKMKQEEDAAFQAETKKLHEEEEARKRAMMEEEAAENSPPESDIDEELGDGIGATVAVAAAATIPRKSKSKKKKSVKKGKKKSVKTKGKKKSKSYQVPQ